MICPTYHGGVINEAPRPTRVPLDLPRQSGQIHGKRNARARPAGDITRMAEPRDNALQIGRNGGTKFGHGVHA